MRKHITGKYFKNIKLCFNIWALTIPLFSIAASFMVEIAEKKNMFHDRLQGIIFVSLMLWTGYFIISPLILKITRSKTFRSKYEYFMIFPSSKKKARKFRMLQGEFIGPLIWLVACTAWLIVISGIFFISAVKSPP